MTMLDGETRLNRFIQATDRNVLMDAGKVTAEIAKAHAEASLRNIALSKTGCFNLTLIN